VKFPFQGGGYTSEEDGEDPEGEDWMYMHDYQQARRAQVQCNCELTANGRPHKGVLSNIDAKHLVLHPVAPALRQ